MLSSLRSSTMKVDLDFSITVVIVLFAFINYGFSVETLKKADLEGKQIGPKTEAFVQHSEGGINVASVISVGQSADVKPKDKINEQLPKLPAGKEKFDYGNSQTTNKFAMEGGGVVEGESILNSPNQELGTGDIENHSKGKGTLVEVPSVVARKGVPENPIITNEPTVPTSTDKPKLPIITEIRKKKPDFASDVRDPDDSVQYLGIKTSTTGEDYIIIGVVAVIGIWFSVFGALIFYRRAGEYWDRRHYRRMDFLVEGMYND